MHKASNEPDFHVHVLRHHASCDSQWTPNNLEREENIEFDSTDLILEGTKLQIALKNSLQLRWLRLCLVQKNEYFVSIFISLRIELNLVGNFNYCIWMHLAINYIRIWIKGIICLVRLFTHIHHNCLHQMVVIIWPVLIHLLFLLLSWKSSHAWKMQGRGDKNVRYMNS